MPQAVPCPDKPPADAGGPSIQPSCGPLPQLLGRVLKVQNPRRMTSEALLKQAPPPSATVTEPDHVGGVQDALAHGFTPQTGAECRNVSQDRPQHGGAAAV
jgi:hypothetical protein